MLVTFYFAIWEWLNYKQLYIKFRLFFRPLEQAFSMTLKSFLRLIAYKLIGPNKFWLYGNSASWKLQFRHQSELQAAFLRTCGSFQEGDLCQLLGIFKKAQFFCDFRWKLDRRPNKSMLY